MSLVIYVSWSTITSSSHRSRHCWSGWLDASLVSFAKILQFFVPHHLSYKPSLSCYCVFATTSHWNQSRRQSSEASAKNVVTTTEVYAISHMQGRDANVSGWYTQQGTSCRSAQLWVCHHFRRTGPNNVISNNMTIWRKQASLMLPILHRIICKDWPLKETEVPESIRSYFDVWQYRMN